MRDYLMRDYFSNVCQPLETVVGELRTPGIHQVICHTLKKDHQLRRSPIKVRQLVTTLMIRIIHPITKGTGHVAFAR